MEPFFAEKKTPVYHDPDLSEQPSPKMKAPRERFIRRTLPAILLLSALWLLFRSAFVYKHHYCSHKGLKEPSEELQQPISSTEKNLVPLEAHIMSKCPDAKDCLQKLVVPSMARMSDKVNFTLSYIGKVDEESDAVSCMHGTGECLGNIIQLCAAKVYPDPKISLGFANCMTSDYKHIPERELVEDCAMEHGVDFKKLNACISDEGEGMDLLRASVERSRDLNVTKSCTVRLAGEIRCIRDGGEWYNCPGGANISDLVDDVEALYKKQTLLEDVDD